VKLAGTMALNQLALGIGNTMAGVLTFKNSFFWRTS